MPAQQLSMPVPPEELLLGKMVCILSHVQHAVSQGPDYGVATQSQSVEQGHDLSLGVPGSGACRLGVLKRIHRVTIEG